MAYRGTNSAPFFTKFVLPNFRFEWTFNVGWKHAETDAPNQYRLLQTTPNHATPVDHSH